MAENFSNLEKDKLKDSRSWANFKHDKLKEIYIKTHPTQLPKAKSKKAS